MNIYFLNISGLPETEEKLVLSINLDLAHVYILANSETFIEYKEMQHCIFFMIYMGSHKMCFLN